MFGISDQHKYPLTSAVFLYQVLIAADVRVLIITGSSTTFLLHWYQLAIAASMLRWVIWYSWRWAGRSAAAKEGISLHFLFWTDKSIDVAFMGINVEANTMAIAVEEMIFEKLLSGYSFWKIYKYWYYYQSISNLHELVWSRCLHFLHFWIWHTDIGLI